MNKFKKYRKVPYYSIIGLLGIYLLIFRSENINSTEISSKSYIPPIETRFDTVPQKPLYVDIYTGEAIDIWFNPQKMMTINRKTNSPIEFYINTSNWDTVYGKGQFVVNNLIHKGDNGLYHLDENKVKLDGDELKIKDGNRKLKIDGDDIKIKENGEKFKYDLKDGEGKVKMDSTKLKADDGEVKLKSGNEKWKMEEGKSKMKKDQRKKKIKNGTVKEQ